MLGYFLGIYLGAGVLLWFFMGQQGRERPGGMLRSLAPALIWPVVLSQAVLTVLDMTETGRSGRRSMAAQPVPVRSLSTREPA